MDTAIASYYIVVFRTAITIIFNYVSYWLKSMLYFSFQSKLIYGIIRRMNIWELRIPKRHRRRGVCIEPINVKASMHFCDYSNIEFGIYAWVEVANLIRHALVKRVYIELLVARVDPVHWTLGVISIDCVVYDGMRDDCIICVEF